MGPSIVDVAEQKRLNDARELHIPWKKWGPYLSERQWGTVREDDDETYRASPDQGCRADTSLSALVRRFLVELVSEESAERCLERQERDLRAQIRDFSAGDRLSREDAHGRRG